MIEPAGKQIATNKITIKDCFGKDMWYKIPDYQRPYVWSDDQINTLLDDISYAALNTPESQYFLGSLVLHCKKEKRENTEYIENSVLDGQQRLTTLYLLQAVMRDRTSHPVLKRTCSEAIFQEGNSFDGIPERLRIEFEIRSDVEDFIVEFVKTEDGTQRIEDLQELKKAPNVSVRNMANAILIINKWLDDEQDINLEDFFSYLRRYVILVYVASSELEDAFRLFTVLNDRGIKLRNSDILKALNLREVEDEKQQREYALFWEDLEGELGEEFDQFLSYVRTIFVKEKARHNLLKEFEDSIYNPQKYNHSTKSFEKAPPLLKKGSETFEAIKKYKKQFDEVMDGNNYHIQNNWAFDNLISVLNDTGLADIWIPPLLFYRHHFGEINIYKFLVKLDNKYSGDWIARETPTFRIEAMNNILKKIEHLSGLPVSAEEKTEKLFSSDVFDFNKKDFIDQLSNNTVYGRRYSRYIMRKIDFLLSGPSYGEKKTSLANMTVEHILPQNPREDSQWVRDFSESDREEWTHKLGNLVLISRRKNSQQGRLDFEEKKKKYFTNSIETFPNSIRVLRNDLWRPEDLKNNHFYLLKRISDHYGIEFTPVYEERLFSNQEFM